MLDSPFHHLVGRDLDCIDLVTGGLELSLSGFERDVFILKNNFTVGAFNLSSQRKYLRL